MVAISLYRGDLHRVADVSRRWLVPRPKISRKDFVALVSRRSRVFARRNSSFSSNPYPNPISDRREEEEEEEKPLKEIPIPQAVPKSEKLDGDFGGERNDVEDSKLDVKPIVDSEAVADRKPDCPEGGSELVGDGEKPPILGKVEEFADPNSEIVKKEELVDEKLNRKKEVEEKLKVLNETKHGLVQLLKQVLNAEEELKRRIVMQGIAARPPAPLQVDPTNDSVSMTRNLTPRMGSELNHSGDAAEGVEGDARSDQNLHSRQIFRMNSTSPSSESPLRRLPYLQHNSGLHHASRTSLGATGSPSRFTPMGHQGHPANLPTLSVSGTNYIASSPSPAASGGTSNFRDSRLPSPWN